MTRVLIPVAVLRGETVSPGLMDLLQTVDVMLLGYYVPPDQTSTDQARSQHGERAISALEDIAQEFEQTGRDVDSRLLFTHDRNQTIRRFAEECNASAIATTGATGTVERLLVSLTGDVAVDRILAFVTGLVGNRDIGVTLFVAGKDTEAARDRLDGAANQLSAAGLDVRTRIIPGSPSRALIDAIPGHDAIVIGQKPPSLLSLVFGEEHDRLASATVTPVLAVRPDN